MRLNEVILYIYIVGFCFVLNVHDVWFSAEAVVFHKCEFHYVHAMLGCTRASCYLQNCKCSKKIIKITNQMFVWHKYPLKKRLKNKSSTLCRALSGNHLWYEKKCFKLALPALQEKSAKCTALCYLLPFQNRCLL